MRYQKFFLSILQGALIGLGAVLPGISGGVLSVIFGIYRPVMELLADPRKNLRTHLPGLLPYLLGYLLGFLGVANVLAFFLNRYPAPSICLFVGLIIGMLPSLWTEAGKEGRSKGSYLSFWLASLFIFVLLFCLQHCAVTIVPDFKWYLFCGFCLALSIIAPGMSFSTLLMPLGLYTPFIDGIGHLTPAVLIPGCLGAGITILVLSRLVNSLFEKHYSIAFHAIVGIVMAATVMIIPFGSFVISWKSCVTNLLCLGIGGVVSVWVARFQSNSK